MGQSPPLVLVNRVAPERCGFGNTVRWLNGGASGDGLNNAGSIPALTVCKDQSL